MTEVITNVNTLLNEPTPSTTTPPPSTEEDSDENDHQMQTSLSDEQSNQGKQKAAETNQQAKTQPNEPEQLFPSPAPDTESEQEKMDTSLSSHAAHTLRSKFEFKFKQLLETNSSFNYLSNNVWILNQIIMPTVGSATTTLQCGSLKIRFSYLENETSAYQNQKKEHLELPDDLKSECDCLSADIKSDTAIQFKNGQIIQRNHLHTLFASNFSGAYSVPLVIYSNELEVNNLQLFDVSKSICLHKTPNGDLNDLNLFLSWLKCFIKQQEELNNLEPKSILINSYLYTLLFRSNISPESVKQELIDLLNEHKIYLLFYPVDSSSDAFNRHIFHQFKENWKQLIIKYAAKTNPNSMLGFVNVFKQTIRETFSTRTNKAASVLQSTFNDLIANFKILNSDLTSEMLSHLTNLTSQQATSDEVSINKDDDATQTSDETEPASTATPTATSAQNVPAIPKPSEQEITELTEWINELCKMGCLCIRYTYLRDLHMRYRPKQLSTSKELLASDNKWTDLMRKAQSKLDYPNENEYVSKWYDMNQWRQAYFNFIRDELKVSETDTVWTFDLIQFPYTKGIVHAPENDYSRRPKNFKPKISVIFAFNAAGDYLAPYFVYPTQFQDEKELTHNECYSHNGYVTSRSFENWLTSSFVPYLNEKERKLTVLLYCGKLAVFDINNLTLCKQHNIRPFGIADEKIKPFTLLFQKSARKRQTDLFLDSWKKVTSKSGMTYQFKCSSRQEFFHLFIDAFQNCIEETGNSNNESLNNEELSTSLNGSQSTAVKDFKNKMVSSFEQCQLWPIKDEDYREYFELTDKINETSNTNSTNESTIQQQAFSSSATSSKVDSAPVVATPSEPAVKKRGRKKSVNESVSVESNQLSEETTSASNKLNGEEKPQQQSDADEENENETEREEPVNKRRKLSMNGKTKKLSYAEILETDADFKNAIEQMIENKIKLTSVYSKKLTSDLIKFMFKSKSLNQSMSASDLKRKLKDKLDSNNEQNEDFLANFLQSILDDSDFFSSVESNGVVSTDGPNEITNNDWIIQELNNLIHTVYEEKATK